MESTVKGFLLENFFIQNLTSLAQLPGRSTISELILSLEDWSSDMNEAASHTQGSLLL